LTTALIILSIACGWLLIAVVACAVGFADEGKTFRALAISLGWPMVLAWIVATAFVDELEWHRHSRCEGD
jgi:hypothetical protein